MPRTTEIVWGVLKTLGMVICGVAVVICFGVFALVAQLWRDLTQRTWRPLVVVFGGLVLIWGPYLVTHPHMDVYLPAQGQAERQGYDLGERVAFLNPFTPGEPVLRRFMDSDRSDFDVKDPVLLAYLRDYQAYYMRFWWGYMAWLGFYDVCLVVGFMREWELADKLWARSAHKSGGYVPDPIYVAPPSPLPAGEGAVARAAVTPPIGPPNPKVAPAPASGARPAPTPAPRSPAPLARRRRGLRVDGANGGSAEFLARLASGEEMAGQDSAVGGIVAPAAAVTDADGEDGSALESGGVPSFKSSEPERPIEGIVERDPGLDRAAAPSTSKPLEEPLLTPAEIERLAREAEEKQLIMPDFTAPAFGRNRDYDRGM